MDIATISILVVIIGCILGLAEWIRLTKNDAGILSAKIHTLETQVKHLQENFEELKNDEKNVEATIQKALEEKIVNEKILALLQEYYDISNID
jgi:outer membrane murein-binding lipoprotein Lpp